MMSTFLNFITSDKVKGGIAIIAAIVMYFTPDEVDKIIEMLLMTFGVSTLVINKKEDTK